MVQEIDLFKRHCLFARINFPEYKDPLKQARALEHPHEVAKFSVKRKELANVDSFDWRFGKPAGAREVYGIDRKYNPIPPPYSKAAE
jgi:hypothetical protein